MDKRLLDILCCPVSKTPVRLASRAELESVNRAVTAGQLQTVAGVTVGQRLDEALVTTDRKVLYRIEDGIPVMLPEEGIGTTQLVDFPAG
jgi:uncharacterized protein YbaR (Trm112 family)